MGLYTLLHPHSTKLIKKVVILFEKCSVRQGHHLRGLPPGIARSLDEKLRESNYKDPDLFYRVDIGLPLSKPDSKTKHSQIEALKAVRNDPNMERESRKQTLRINLEETFKEWTTSLAPAHIQKVADHYGIFEHLFGDAYFKPVVPMNISFASGDVEHPVYHGNIIRPSEAVSKPTVTYTSDNNSLWALLLTNLDGHFTDSSKEYIHWFVGNIPGQNIEKGETIVNYLQPFPPKGTGYHRFVFVLYKQERRLDFSKFNLKDVNNFDLESRTFLTLDFYREQQDNLTPAGLSFFQSHWDTSLKNFYHNELQMKEPIFEYDFDPPYIRPQEWFPLRKPFNLYMDKYRILSRSIKNF
ncbi:hypothetical protein HHI36_015181 [Cryptolaemus montrouzieri]|uniref:Large ribosomal subunit protein mL38 n=1 Tax=Cryptolaemus montrouzieri TaxID=559131 RepID=A0ABD2N4W2_9CUCU